MSTATITERPPFTRTSPGIRSLTRPLVLALALMSVGQLLSTPDFRAALAAEAATN